MGEIAALIGQCDEFIGYDSACQHIAAAVQTPAVTIFAGSNDMNFVRRWSACGNVPHKIVHVDTLTDPQNINTNEVISRIMAERPKKETEDRRRRQDRIQKSTLDTDSVCQNLCPISRSRRYEGAIYLSVGRVTTGL